MEASVSLPGTPDITGLWPAFWTMGNLGRASYGSTLEGMWYVVRHLDEMGYNVVLLILSAAGLTLMIRVIPVLYPIKQTLRRAQQLSLRRMERRFHICPVRNCQRAHVPVKSKNAAACPCLY